jgi:hypothetical protein
VIEDHRVLRAHLKPSHATDRGAESLVLELTVTFISAMTCRLTMHIGEARCSGPAAGLLRKGAVARALKLRRRRRDERAPSELSAARQSGRPVGLDGRWGLVSGSSAICQPAQVVRSLAGLTRLGSQTGSQVGRRRATPGDDEPWFSQLDHLSGPGQPRAATGRMRLKSGRSAVRPRP